MDNKRILDLTLSAVDQHLQDLQNQIMEATQFKEKLQLQEFIWDAEIDLDSPPQRHGLTGKTGIYVKMHKPSNTAVYVGQGNPIDRRSTHKAIFKNKGETVVFTDESGQVTSSVDSPAARKMYRMDPEISNWSTRIAVMPKPIAAKLESLLSKELTTEFNDSKMLGKS